MLNIVQTEYFEIKLQKSEIHIYPLLGCLDNLMQPGSFARVGVNVQRCAVEVRVWAEC